MTEENINAAMCIKEKTHWGYDTMINFCTGKRYNVDWVTSDYVGAYFGIVFIILVIIGLIWLVWDINTNW